MLLRLQVPAAALPRRRDAEAEEIVPASEAEAAAPAVKPAAAAGAGQGPEALAMPATPKPLPQQPLPQPDSPAALPPQAMPPQRPLPAAGAAAEKKKVRAGGQGTELGKGLVAASVRATCAFFAW